jgi:hypothetical protein
VPLVFAAPEVEFVGKGEGVVSVWGKTSDVTLTNIVVPKCGVSVVEDETLACMRAIKNMLTNKIYLVEVSTCAKIWNSLEDKTTLWCNN